jgi:hypothetical protein
MSTTCSEALLSLRASLETDEAAARQAVVRMYSHSYISVSNSCCTTCAGVRALQIVRVVQTVEPATLVLRSASDTNTLYSFVDSVHVPRAARPPEDRCQCA